MKLVVKVEGIKKIIPSSSSLFIYSFFFFFFTNSLSVIFRINLSRQCLRED